jgi:hypothetical protein
MSQVNPGLRLMSCGCLLNTTVQKDGTGRLDISPCKTSCPNYHFVIAKAEEMFAEVTHTWED